MTTNDMSDLRAELEAVRAELKAERRKTREAALSMRNRAVSAAITAVWRMPAHGWAELNRAMGAVYSLPLETDRTPGAPTIHDDAAHGVGKLSAAPGMTTCGLPVGDVGIATDHPDTVTCPWCRDLILVTSETEARCDTIVYPDSRQPFLCRRTADHHGPCSPDPDPR